MRKSEQIEIYFFSAGQVSGPFSHQDVLKLEKDGGLDSLDWMWISSDAKWVAVDESRVGLIGEKPAMSPSEFLSKNEIAKSSEETPFESDVAAAFCRIAGRALKGVVRSKNALGLQFLVEKRAYSSAFPLGVAVDMVSFSASEGSSSVKTFHLADCVEDESSWTLFLRHSV